MDFKVTTRRADSVLIIDLAGKFTAGEALTVLGGRLFESGFCERHAGAESLCTHSIDCSLRSLWRALQTAVDQVLTNTTLKDLLCSEPEMVSLMTDLVRTPTRAQLVD